MYWDVNIAYRAINTLYQTTRHNSLAKTLMAYDRYIFAQLQGGCPGRRFAKPWMTFYKYNNVYCVEIVGNQKEGKIDTKK